MEVPRNVWEMDAPVVTNTQEAQKLIEHKQEIIGKVVTYKGMLIDKGINDLMCFYKEHPSKICFDSCQITYLSVILQCTSCREIAINNCSLTADDAIEVLDMLDPHSPANVDFSNNKIGAKGSFFLDEVLQVIKKALCGFKSINLKNNEFTKKDIDKFRESLSSMNLGDFSNWYLTSIQFD